MKTPWQIIRITLFAVLIAAAIFHPRQAHAAHTKGYFWVVETNLRKNNTSTICFYSATNQLLYSEEIKGYLDIRKPSNARILNISLKRYLKGKKLKRKLRRKIVNVSAIDGTINYNEDLIS